MRLIILVCFLGLILTTDAQIPEACLLSDTNRPPENSDISVNCGTESIDMSIYLCPVYQALYNESLLALNGQFTKPSCLGTTDWNASPPVIKYKIPLNESAISVCSNSFKVTNDVGSGQFSDFSSVQSVNISGAVLSTDPSAGTITYRIQLLYKFSCRYPLQYLLNNTQLTVTGVSVAIRDNNGSFISTLSMQLYKDSLYQEVLTIPPAGLHLKTKIYVSVKATNLTDRFNVLLDRCFATTTPYPTHTKFYDLFVGCNRDAQTKVELNGVTQKAHFSFEAFRFIEHQNLTLSTFYLHCATRLCEVPTCSSLLPSCSAQPRVRREVQDVLPNATVSSAVIYVGRQTDEGNTSRPGGGAEGSYSSPVVAVIVCIVVLTIVIFSMACYFALCIGRRKPAVH